MATELGQAYVQIIPSARGISGALSGMVNPAAESAGISGGNLLGSGLVKMFTGFIAAAGIGKILTDSLMSGADLQQSFGGLDTLYDGAQESAKGFATEAYKAGISANSYAEQAVSMGAALKNSLGGDATKAAEAANMAIMDMADNAAKMGTPIESLQMAYQGFAKQNYTMLDNLKLGYGGTKSEMERLLADAEKFSGVKYDINNLADVNSAIHEIQNNLGLSGVAADEAKTTFHGSFGAMKSSASNFLADLSLGNDIQPSLMALSETTSTFLFDNFIPMVGNIAKSLPTVLTTVLSEAGPALAGGLQSLFGSVGINIDFASISSKFEGVAKAFQPVIDGFKTAFGQLPGLFQSVATAAGPIFDTIMNGLSNLDFSGIKVFIEAIIPALQSGFEKFMSIAGPAIDGVVSSF